jgi:hypothetical protein
MIKRATQAFFIESMPCVGSNSLARPDTSLAASAMTQVQPTFPSRLGSFIPFTTIMHLRNHVFIRFLERLSYVT